MFQIRSTPRAGKIYFKAADIEEHLKSHYVPAFSSKKNKRHGSVSI